MTEVVGLFHVKLTTPIQVQLGVSAQDLSDCTLGSPIFRVVW